MGPERVRRALRAAVLAALLPAGAARAGIEGGAHDLIAQGYDVVRTSASQERCTRCHLAGSDSSGLVPAVPPVFKGVWDVASLACFSCHDGTTIVAPEVDASLTAYHPRAHGMQLGAYRDLARTEIGLPLPAEDRLGCTTCHAPHDATNRPFLRVALPQLCPICHAPSAGSGRGEDNLSGNHPTGPILGLVPGAVPIAVGEAFRVPFPAGYPLERGATSPGVHWDLGGHLDGGATGDVACSTCHAVHGDEQAAPLPRLLALDPVREVADRFCEGCHAGRRGDGRSLPPAPNPGGTSTARTYHPADDDVGNGEDRAPATRSVEGWPVGAAPGAPLLCTTCHRPHGAAQGTALLRAAPEDAPFCEACHDRLDLPWHHPVLDEAQGRCAQNLPAAGALPTGRVTCARCHRAHNAGLGAPDEAAFVPLLRERGGAGSCGACHPEGNPTCSGDSEGQASHFLGDPTLPETYEDAKPPLRTDPWPETGLYSTYGGDRDQVVTCLSCHSFRKEAAARAEEGDAGTSRRFLVARSGGAVEWEEDEGLYLCTGCHTANPGTGSGEKGHTHPLMEANVEKLGRDPTPPVTATPNLRVNCDSCHRPHEALTRGGYYIMEVVSGENRDPRAVHPKIDYTPLCQSCHDAEKY